MDFLCFKASHGKEFAIPISDAVSIVANPVITHVPGAADSIVGIAKYLDDLIAVVDLSLALEGEYEKVETMIVVKGQFQFGILVEQVTGIVRNNMPLGCSLLDVRDFENNLRANKASHVNDVEFF